MLYAKILDKEVIVFPYTISDLKKENKFSTYDNRYTVSDWYKQTEEAQNNKYYVVNVNISSEPSYNQLTHYISLQNSPKFIDNNWIIGWDVFEKNNITENTSLVGAQVF